MNKKIRKLAKIPMIAKKKANVMTILGFLK